MFDGTTFSAQDIKDAKEIVSLHNRQLPAIKEIRAKMELGIREAKRLVDYVWNNVDHPENVEYNGLDRVQVQVNLYIRSVLIDGSNLKVIRSDSESRSIKISKKAIQELRDFGVASLI